MLDFYAWPTSNGLKISIMLEEIELPHRVLPVNILAGEQFAPEFLAISPNNKIPAIVDHDTPDGDPISIFESGAILMYLAEKSGRFWPTETRPRYEVAQWLMWQMAGFGPMLGQAGHFLRNAPEPIPYALERYGSEARRLFLILDRRLAHSEYMAGDYSIADIATYPWSLAFSHLGISIDDFSHVKRWQEAIAARPAVAKGMQLLSEVRRQPSQLDEKARKILFGEKR